MDLIREHKKLIIVFAAILLVLIIIAGAVVLFINNQNRLSDEADPQKELYRKRYQEYDHRLSVNRDQIEYYIEELSSDKYEGRKAGTSGEAEAALYLAGELKRFGYKTFFGDNYFQRFSVPQTALLENNRRYYLYPKEGFEFSYADNVIGYLGNEEATQFVILSAYYDHLGQTNSQVPRIFSGANRNASGVSAVLEVARVLSEHKEQLDYQIIIAFWSGHETGLMGSKAFVDQLSQSELDNILLAINVDTIGSLGSQHYLVCKENNAPDFFIKEALAWEAIDIEEYDETYKGDHIYFARRNTPAITLISENWEQGTASFTDTYFGVDTLAVNNLAQHIANYLYWLEGEQNDR